MYKVFAGSFKSRENAQERVAFLRSIGIQSFIVTTTISGETWHQVQAGAYSSRTNAENRVTEISKATEINAFIAAENQSSSPNSDFRSTPIPTVTPTDTSNSSQPPSPSANQQNPTSILGPTLLTAEQMNQYVRKINPKAALLGSFYKTLGEYYGIRGDVAFAQAMLETDYFRFTGDVRNGQNNFAGIGAIGGGVRGASFKTPQDGVLAQFQHLYAYATNFPLPNRYPLVDLRFHLVNRGSATTWTALNGKWAVPGSTYGQSILNLYHKMTQA
ncbi:glucosaminidase domain-containing protein [Bacillus sp. EB106-08-02-XG196]|jgi:flagellum-specific peptidoglycan hydrolase FlgJ|uniref:SPOR domain-containing protein n=1 Tax=Bacillus sp. EB106-08-02-XG196 TaxID=2737049 RepID=UPI0015C4DAFF|nr:SPOR domain-containing protein [Bacillus sp. EB106-08-02-XG196]NWQ39565.1 glucosaminidase domain-containing protein [Bacillus sp. EB106-08-02-XG196]